MAIRSVVTWPDTRLSVISTDVKHFNRGALTLYHDLVDTMRAEDGLGIAAPQIGVSRRMFVVAETLTRTPHPVAFLNPQINYFGRTEIDIEGCLSFPGAVARVQRHERVVVTAQNLDGEIFKVDAVDLYARCLQHEYDHLTGKVLADYGLIRVPD